MAAVFCCSETVGATLSRTRDFFVFESVLALGGGGVRYSNSIGTPPPFRQGTAEFMKKEQETKKAESVRGPEQENISEKALPAAKEAQR